MAALAQESKESEISTLKDILQNTAAERDNMIVELSEVKREEMKNRAALETAKQAEFQSVAGSKLRLQAKL